ncbi:MAG: sensor histidine kinase [Chloroflexota bacterium]|nr:sensor histidine kinase [Chloroflexota bacterium]
MSSDHAVREAPVTRRVRPGGDHAPAATPPRVVWTFLRIPLLFKVLIANAAIVVLGAVVGTWLTATTVRSAPEDSGVVMIGVFVVLGVTLSLAVNYVVLRAAFQPLHELEDVAASIRQGDFSRRAEPGMFGDPRLSSLVSTFNATLDALVRDRLELRHLASQVIRAQEQERQRVARELHDDTAQVLFAQLLQLAALKRSPVEDVARTASDFEQMTVEALESVRRLALELRPPALDDLGLFAALEGLAQRFSDQLDIPVDVRIRGPRTRLSAELELVLYRIAQEALTNVAKHARATRAAIDVDRAPDGLSLSIRDDGRGFAVTEPASPGAAGLGLGIFGMNERAALVGGTLNVWQRAGGGSEVFVFIPIGAVTAIGDMTR